MPTFFRISVDLPVGTGPTGGCAYCATAAGGEQHAASSTKPNAHAARRATPTHANFLKLLLTKNSLSNFSTPAARGVLIRLRAARRVLRRPRRVVLLRALLRGLRALRRLLPLLLRLLALEVKTHGLVYRETNGARLLVGPAVVVKLPRPLVADDREFRLRLRHVFRPRLVVEVVLLPVVGRHLPAGRELQARLRRQALLRRARQRRRLYLLRLFALLEVVEHQEHDQAHDNREERQPADEPQQRAHRHVRLLVRHVRVRDERHVRRLVYAVSFSPACHNAGDKRWVISDKKRRPPSLSRSSLIAHHSSLLSMVFRRRNRLLKFGRAEREQRSRGQLAEVVPEPDAAQSRRHQE